MRRLARIVFGPRTTPQWKDAVRAPKLRFRRAGPGDATALADVCARACATYVEWAPAGWQPWASDPSEIDERLRRDGTWGLIAELGSVPVGYVILNPAREVPGVAQIWHLFVLPQWWGGGVATELLASALAEARKRGYREAFLRTPRDNARARRFYEREGWRASSDSVFGPEIGLELVEYRRMLPQ